MMTKHWMFVRRRVAPIVSAGVLFQATGCVFDTTDISQVLVTSIVNNLIASFVFGLFSLPIGF